MICAKLRLQYLNEIGIVQQSASKLLTLIWAQEEAVRLSITANSHNTDAWFSSISKQGLSFTVLEKHIICFLYCPRHPIPLHKRSSPFLNWRVLHKLASCFCSGSTKCYFHIRCSIFIKVHYVKWLNGCLRYLLLVFLSTDEWACLMMLFSHTFSWSWWYLKIFNQCSFI